jgi:hypothetical protein
MKKRAKTRKRQPPTNGNRSSPSTPRTEGIRPLLRWVSEFIDAPRNKRRTLQNLLNQRPVAQRLGRLSDQIIAAVRNHGHTSSRTRSTALSANACWLRALPTATESNSASPPRAATKSRCKATTSGRIPTVTHAMPSGTDGESLHRDRGWQRGQICRCHPCPGDRRFGPGW